MINWHSYPDFTEDEFKCSFTGLAVMNKQFMDKLQKTRTAAGFPFIITSGYRHPTHPIEVGKAKPGEHTKGMAADISISGENVIRLLSLAHENGFIRFGVSQKPGSRFIHLGTATADDGFSETTWSY